MDVNADPEQITDPDERARLLAAKENRDAKTFNFKVCLYNMGNVNSYTSNRMKN